MNHQIIDPERRNQFPKRWKGFDLSGFKCRDIFYGCEKCGVQTVACAVSIAQCPNCLGDMFQYRVTKQDLDASPIGMNSRRSFVKSLLCIPAALAGVASVRKPGWKRLLDQDELIQKGNAYGWDKGSYWNQESRWSTCYSQEYLDALKNWDGRGVQFY